MSILIDQTKRVLVKGITGREGMARARLMKEYGTNVVAGVTPGKGGQEVLDVPVFDTIEEAWEEVGPFDIKDSVAQAMLRKTNPHGLSNAEVIKPWMNASDITKRSRNKWIIDFGELSAEDAALFEAPFKYV